MNPFDYNFHPSEEMVKDMESLRSQFKSLVNNIIAATPDGRERALAITKIEEAAMWTNKAIAHREPDAKHPAD